MQVTLDQQPCVVAGASVWDAIAEASAIAQSKGRLIVEVIVDGAPLSDADVAELQGAALGARTVELTSAHAGALVAEVFAEVDESLALAEKLQTEAAETLQTGAQVEAMAKLAEAINIWQSAQRALTLGMEAMESAGGEADRSATHDPVLKLRMQLDSICESLRQRDMVAIADALLYELPACVQQWRALLQSLRQLALGDERAERSGAEKP